jgi:tetratricopeptide (TPR) repeat protein
MPTAIEPASFVSRVRPLLETNNVSGLVETLHQNYSCGQIARLVNQCDCDARKVGLLCLAMVGGRDCIDTVVPQLANPDPVINQMAEHALWSIWFRLGTPQANAELGRGCRAMSARNLACAMEHFDRAIEFDRSFAEAYNQRAIARFLLDEFEESIADCRKAVRLMPSHFGALAGMGHCFLHLGQMSHALRAYERALAVNPHLSGVRATVDEIRRG